MKIWAEKVNLKFLEYILYGSLAFLMALLLEAVLFIL